MGERTMFRTIARMAVAASMVLSTVAAPASAQDGGRDMARILSQKVVRVGAVEGFPSYRQDLASGKWEGIFPEIVEALFGAIGVKVEYVPTEWGTAAAGLQSGRFDLIGGYSATPERALAVAFTAPVARVGVGLAATSQEKQRRAANWADLNKPEVRIALADGSATMRMVQRLLPKATLVAVKTEDAAILELESGRVDYFSSTDSILFRYGQARANVRVIFPNPEVGQNSTFALRRGERDFQDWLNVSLGSLIADGTIPAIRERYLNPSK
jgi:polar amino acid transport system substrate-binding protein